MSLVAERAIGGSAGSQLLPVPKWMAAQTARTCETTTTKRDVTKHILRCAKKTLLFINSHVLSVKTKTCGR